jgi:3-hydroxyisobutyrate dehydrogenase-like beta-hydroxyacid dehydrogenase
MTPHARPVAGVGFIGFGEVGSILSEALAGAGIHVAAYDVLLDQPGGREILQARVRRGVVVFGSLAEVVRGADYVLSTATTQVAAAVAESCAQHLEVGQVYVDLNSTAPATKLAIAQIIGRTGADFVEGAILGAVGATGAKTEILTAGIRGEEVARQLSALGLNARYYHPEIGKASMFKMLRSVVSKGLEALLLEMMIAGARTGIAVDLWEDITGLMTHTPFDLVASNWIKTHPAAHERRYHEMVQVEETLRMLGLEPLMTAATVSFFSRSRALKLGDAFPGRPRSTDEVIGEMGRRLAEPKPSSTGGHQG